MIRILQYIMTGEKTEEKENDMMIAIEENLHSLDIIENSIDTLNRQSYALKEESRKLLDEVEKEVERMKRLLK